MALAEGLEQGQGDVTCAKCQWCTWSHFALQTELQRPDWEKIGKLQRGEINRAYDSLHEVVTAW